MLTAKQRRFCIEYPVDSNGTQAAIRAGYAEGSAQQTASDLLLNPLIKAAIAEREAELAAAAGLTVEAVLRDWLDIANADPNELIYIRVECCRYCHGVNHRYQWTEHEYALAVEAASRHICNKRAGCNSDAPDQCPKRLPPDGLGGFGFNPHNEPAEDCPVCFGDGVEKVKARDSRNLKGSARRLYAGVKQTQNGIEIKMRDQDAAKLNLAKYLKMLIDRSEVAGPNGGPIPVAGIRAADLTDDQLAAIIAGK